MTENSKNLPPAEENEDDFEVQDFTIVFKAKELVGRKIVAVRNMTPEEIETLTGNDRSMGIPVVIQLDDGSLLWAQSDEEGNDLGCIVGQGADGEEFFYVMEQ